MDVNFSGLSENFSQNPHKYYFLDLVLSKRDFSWSSLRFISVLRETNDSINFNYELGYIIR